MRHPRASSALSVSGLRAVAYTVQPEAARRSAVARPMPDEQPVTSTAREVVESVMELKLLEPWPVNSISTGSRPSTRASWRRRSRTRTCTSAASRCSRAEPPDLDEFLAHIESRLHLVPRYRQKLATPPLETGRPLWIDDPTFNLAYHVRHTALPPPGDEGALLNLCARVFAQRLDRSKPLWELWLVEGLQASER